MRNEKIIQLSENRAATVRELRLKDVRRLVVEMKSLSSLQLTDLFGEQFDRLLAISGDLVTMPEGETAEDLSLSEAELVIQAMQEVNASFLAKMGLSLELAQPFSQPQSVLSETLTEQPAD